MATQIQSLEELNISEILKNRPEGISSEFNFESLANIVMNQIYIYNGKYKYHPIEIEFYVYDKKKHADVHVYPRVAEAGKIFFHLSGMDICFKSSIEADKDDNICFGGILIRALEREYETKTEMKARPRFGGPLTCVNEVLNSATNTIKAVVAYPNEEQKYTVTNNPKIRKGINRFEKKKDDYWDAKYRFFRNDIGDNIMIEDETFDFNLNKKIPRKRKYKIEN